VGFVGVVCSRTRATSLLAEMALSPEEAGRVHTHVGVEIGARTAPELGLSIMAAVVRGIRVEGLAGALPEVTPVTRPEQAVDPVCGMTVTIGPDTPHATVDGTEYWFCHAGCRTAFLEACAS